MDKNLLSVKELSYRIGKRDILKNISFDLRRGEILGVLGPNGSGKSTLLSILNGSLKNQKGTIFFQGEPALQKGIMAPFAREQTGVVFQETSCDKKLSALENLYLSAELYGMKTEHFHKRLEHYLRQVNLWDRASEPVSCYSGGMRRRLELVRVILQEPRLMLMDEPSAALDQQGIRTVWKIIDEMRSFTGVLMATHHTEEAELCDRILVLKKGEVVEDTTPHLLRNKVSGDKITLTLAPHLEQGEQERVLHQLQTAFIGTHVFSLEKGAIQVTTERGANWVPRLVEALPPLMLEAVTVRRPSLADAYLLVTGESLNDDTPTMAA